MFWRSIIIRHLHKTSSCCWTFELRKKYSYNSMNVVRAQYISWNDWKWLERTAHTPNSYQFPQIKSLNFCRFGGSGLVSGGIGVRQCFKTCKNGQKCFSFLECHPLGLQMLINFWINFLVLFKVTDSLVALCLNIF